MFPAQLLFGELTEPRGPAVPYDCKPHASDPGMKQINYNCKFKLAAGISGWDLAARIGARIGAEFLALASKELCVRRGGSSHRCMTEEL